MIKSVIGNVDVIDSQIYRQNQFVDAYQSIVNLNKTLVTDIIVADVLIKFIISTMIIDNIEIVNVTNPYNLNYAAIAGSTESNIYAKDFAYLENSSPFLVLVDVGGTISNIIIDSSTSISRMIDIDL